MANEASTMKTAYHIETGPHQMYEIDANGAVAHHPAEWSFTPWELQDTNAYRQKRYEREAAEAKAAGRPEPIPPADLTLTDAEQADLDTDGQARADAAELVAQADAEEAKRKDREQAVAAARALLASPVSPPTPRLAGIAPMDPKERDQVAIPDDWESMSAPKIRALAIKLNAPNTVTVDDAKARIAAEAKRRADGPAKPVLTNPIDTHPSEQQAADAAAKKATDTTSQPAADASAGPASPKAR